jgi:hypothetical protein
MIALIGGGVCNRYTPGPMIDGARARARSSSSTIRSFFFDSSKSHLEISSTLRGLSAVARLPAAPLLRCCPLEAALPSPTGLVSGAAPHCSLA